MTNNRHQSKRSRTVKPENDTDIWQRAMRDTKPLVPRCRRETEFGIEKCTPPVETEPSSCQANSQHITSSKRNQAPGRAPPGRLDKHVARRLKRGSQNIEARLDLHGMTQKEAHANLRHFICDTAVRGCRCVLVITGKGTHSRGKADTRDTPQGVLSRMVPRWLLAPDLSMYIVGFEPALRHHGGAGALYIQLRRSKPGNEG